MFGIINLVRALPFMLLISGAGYAYHWYETQKLKSQIADLKYTALQCEQRSEILEAGKQHAERLVDQMQVENQEQQQRITVLQRENQTISKQRDEYLSIFKRHDLTNLARAKPGLIEPRINKGTKAVFDDVEQITQENENEQDGFTPFVYDDPALDGLQ